MPPPRKHTNKLNDLTNREWLMETKSFWWSQAEGGAWTAEDLLALAGWLCDRVGEERAAEMLTQRLPSYMLSIAPPRDKRKLLHPATFSEKDVERLIRFFSKEGERVLDPFLGSGSTLVACRDAGRVGTGIELIDQWAQVARERLADSAAGCPRSGHGPRAGVGTPSGLRPDTPPLFATGEQTIIHGDALSELRDLPPDSFDFIVTSPPYWSILDKRGMKTEAERESRDLPTKYSESEADLGNISDYEEFLDRLAEIFGECGRVLRPKRYMAVIVSDFRHGPHFVLYHADLARRIEQAGLPLKGITILLQDSKNLYPFGVPNAFVSNVHHQYILIHQKV